MDSARSCRSDSPMKTIGSFATAAMDVPVSKDSPSRSTFRVSDIFGCQITVCA